MKLIDLSQPVYYESPNCPTHPPVRCEVLSDHPTEGWRMERLNFSSHTGSHLDAPLHKLSAGPSIDRFDLATFAGPAVIADLRDSEPGRAINAEALEPKLPQSLQGLAVLLATGWGARRAKSDEWLYHSPRLTAEGARWLIDRGVRGIGIDHYSIGGIADPENSETHSTILGAGLWILEELKFPDEVFTLRQPVTLWCLPINLKGHSGAPCRPVIAVE